MTNTMVSGKNAGMELDFDRLETVCGGGMKEIYNKFKDYMPQSVMDTMNSFEDSKETAKKLIENPKLIFDLVKLQY